MAAVQEKLTKGAPQVGRQKVIEPDPQSPRGQWALWLRYHFPANRSIPELAEALGVAKQTAHNWYNGTTVPDVDLWRPIAEFCGIDHASTWSLSPPPEFVRYVLRYGKLPPDGRYSLKSN